MNSGSQFKRGLELQHAAIDRLPIDLKAALAAACTQRQTQIYRAYKRRTGTPHSAGFDNLLDSIWDKIQHRQSLGAKEHLEWQNRAKRLYPGDKAKRDISKGCAQIAVLGLLCTNNVLMTGNTEDTRNAAHEAFMSIYHSLTSSMGQKPQFDPFEPDAEEKIFAHPLIEVEHRRQERDLYEVEQAFLRPATIPDFANMLRKRAEIEARDFLPIIDGQPV